MARLAIIACLLFLHFKSSSQYNWKLEKDKEGIKVYTSSTTKSSFKSVKVECTLQGTYSKLFSVLSDVENFENWIYHTKNADLLKKNTPYDFVYYTVISLPWPLSNRDLAIHMTIKTDSLPKFLIIQGRNEKNVLPDFPSRVRVPHYMANWKVTKTSANQIHISYVLELDPGGAIPASIANNFVDKGPFETFKNLAEQLLK